MKPLIGGLIDRSEAPSSSYYGVVNAYAIDTKWCNLQPTAGGPLVTPNAIDTAIAYVRSVNSGPGVAGLTLKLRVDGGINAPDWAKTIGGFTPITVTLQDGSGTVGPFWTSAYQDAWNAFQALLAVEYDSVPEIREVVIGGGICEIFVEPFLRDLSDKTTRKFLNHGYTAELDMGVIQDTITNASVWQTSRISMAFNPYHAVGGHLDEVFTADMITLLRSTYGAQAVLENYSIRSTTQSPAYDSMYATIKSTGGPIAFQTATMDKVGDLLVTLSWAIEQGASSVELPAGYETSFTPSDLEWYSATLAAQA